MAVNDKLRLVSQSSLYGVSCFNLFNFIETGESASFSSERALVDTFVTDIMPLWMAAVGDDFTVHCLTGEKLGPGPGSPYTLALSTANVGTAGTPSLPANRCMRITQYSAPGMTSAIGGKSLSGIPANEESDNALTIVQFNLLKSLAASLKGTMVGVGGFAAEHVIRSGNLLTDSAVVASIASAQVRTLSGRTPRLC